MKAIVLAAGVGNRLRSVTGVPKCLIEIDDTTLLERYLGALETLGVCDVVIVVGYHQEMVGRLVSSFDFHGSLTLILNPRFIRGSVLSLDCASEHLSGDVLLMDGDVYFEDELLRRVVDTPESNTVAIDTTSSSTGEEMMVGASAGRIVDMRRDLSGEYELVGEAVGFYRLGPESCEELRGIVSARVSAGDIDIGYEEVLPQLFALVPFSPVVIDGLRWVEIDFPEDIQRAGDLAHPGD
jgi:choline kinase